jgi:hypothetical protein
MKTLPYSVRVWFAVLLFSAGALCLRAVWAEPIGSMGPQQQVDNCGADYSDCAGECNKQWESGKFVASELGDCSDVCLVNYITCLSKIRKASKDGASAPLQSPPPNQVGPNSTPTPTPGKHPIGSPIIQSSPPNELGFNPTSSPTPRRHPTRPPKRLGASPTPSATAHPILLAKPAKPTPTPKPTPKQNDQHHNHSHH